MVLASFASSGSPRVTPRCFVVYADAFEHVLCNFWIVYEIAHAITVAVELCWRSHVTSDTVAQEHSVQLRFRSFVGLQDTKSVDIGRPFELFGGIFHSLKEIVLHLVHHELLCELEDIEKMDYMCRGPYFITVDQS